MQSSAEPKIYGQIKKWACIKRFRNILCGINTGVFPEELKAATVSPVFKNKESYLKSKYRPISVLPSVSKIFERIICDQMQSYFSTLLSNLLSGFRKGYSTQHALFRVIETWKQSLDSKGAVGTILMDLSKAYNCIPHNLLIVFHTTYRSWRLMDLTEIVSD